MSIKKQALRDLVTQRLVAAADEVFALIEQAFAEYEAEIVHLKWTKLQQQNVVQHKEDVQTAFAHHEAQSDESAEEEKLCNALPFPFTPLKPEYMIDSPTFLQQESAEENGHEVAADEPLALSSGLPPSHYKKTCSASDTDDSQEWENAQNIHTPSNKPQRQRKRRHGPNESELLIKRERDNEPDACNRDECNPGTSISDMSEEPFSCSEQGQSVSQDDSLLSKASAKRKTATCPECGVTVRGDYSLERHISAVHRRERPYRCPVCERAFAQKTDCVIHMSTHTGAKPFTCPVCLRVFGFKKSLQRHMKLHSSQ